MDRRTLIGYGGGKGGDGAARAPVESPNTLTSPSWARVVDLLCEGEIEGLADYDSGDANAALKSIFLNGVPVRNADGSYNYHGVGAYGVSGTQSQEYIPGFSDVESEVAVAVEVTNATPIVRTITDSSIDAVVVTIEVPQLYHVDNDGDPPTGDMLPTSVEIAIDVQSNGGGYVTQDLGSAATISGKCTKAYDRGYRIPLTGSAPWDIKVRRVTPDNGSTTLQNQTFWKSYTQVIDQKLSYPNSAVIGLEIPAAQFSSIPARSYLVKGLKVKVPTNYDPATRTYSGVWDGTFKIAWTDNPAWCFYDLLTTSRYGLGKYIDAASVDKWGLYTIAQYCDELVPDGKGGTEPRFRCNLYLQAQEDAYRVVNDMASIFRAMAYWASGAVQVSQDSPADAEYLFTPANVVDGLFTYSSSAKRARHTVAIVTWNDPSNHYAATREYVTDEDGLALYGYQPVEVAAFGCTSQGQAQRVGRWLLFTERLETETVAFRTGIEGALRNPGAIITIQDPYRAGKRLGGRVVSATTTDVQLDADLVIESGKTYTLSVLLPDGTVAEGTVTNAPSTWRTLTLSAPLASAPNPEAMWVVSVSDLVPVYYRVISVTEEEEGTYQITALRHEPGKYDLVENGVKIQTPSTSAIPSSLAPTSLVVGEALYKNSAGIKVRLQASWDQNIAATKYAVRWRQGGGNWSNEEFVDQHFWEHLDVTPGLYWVQVQAIIAGLRTDTVQASYTVLGKTAPPADVTGLAATVHPLTTTVSWSPVADLDLDHYEIRTGGTDWSTATLFSKSDLTSFEFGHDVAGSVTFRVKAVDTSGNYSVNAASVTFTVAVTIGGTTIADGGVVPRALAPGIAWGLLPLNGDFEASNIAGAPPDGWATGSGAWSVGFELETSTVYSGSHAIRAVDNAASAEIISQTFPVTSDKRYVFEVDTYAVSSPTAGAAVYVDWYTGALALISSQSFGGPSGIATGSWQTQSSVLTSPSNALYARIRLYKPTGTGAAGDWIVDRVQVMDADQRIEAWHGVGSLLNSWVDVTAGEPPGYYKNGSGEVVLRGRVKSGTGGTGNPIFALPAGYRPDRIMRFPVRGDTSYAAVAVDTSGNVYLYDGTNVDVGLDGIRFRAA